MQYFAMGRNAGHPESSVGGFFTEFLPSFYVLLFWSVCEEHFSGVVSFFLAAAAASRVRPVETRNAGVE